MLRAAAGVALVVPWLGWTAATAQSSDLAIVLRGLADRTQQYYDRFISIICTETVHHQDLRSNLAPAGRPRITVFELNVTRDESPGGDVEFRIGRTLQFVNGRPARRNEPPGCTDPKTGSPEPLAFLLSANQWGYRFMLAKDSAGGPAGARAVDFIEEPPERVTITWAGNCFNAEGGGHEGRVWFDPTTFDVLQVTLRLSKPFMVPLPKGVSILQPAIRVERSEATLRFSRVEFQQPTETVMLPESIETLNVLRGAPSMRIHQRLSDFRRFLAESTIRVPPA
jgi:hypothetical protein